MLITLNYKPLKFTISGDNSVNELWETLTSVKRTKNPIPEGSFVNLL